MDEWVISVISTAIHRQIQFTI